MDSLPSAPAGMARLWLGCGAAAGCAGIVIAALLAHRAGFMDPRQHALAATALQVQMWHALALLALAALRPSHGRAVDVAGGGFVFGGLAFCGAVYAAALDHAPALPIAPVGGTVLIGAWAWLAAAAARGRR